ncbi:MAG: anti-sigma factor [Mariniblastus sp.]|nr:anti-sigma factor [Mariniblastus sp.]
MNLSSSSDPLMDLLIARPIHGLSPSETDRLANLQAEAELEDDRSFDYTIAMIDVALERRDAPGLPDHVYSRVIDEANQFIKPQPGTPRKVTDTVSRPAVTTFRPREIVAWLTLAASLALAVFLWTNKPSVTEQLSISQLERVPDLERIELHATDDLSAQSLASAEVLWSDSLQQGVARYRGLTVNDPSVEQYQLWIIDRERGFQQRVDGGVFNISSKNSEIAIPIRAKLAIFDAKGFAVTREPPGGVVVSDLKRVALISEKAAE